MRASNILNVIFRPAKISIMLSGMLFGVDVLKAGDLYVGTSTVDITPALPVALMGQFYLRVANTAETPISASIIAIESRNQNKTVDVAVFVSCDLVAIPAILTQLVRERVKKLLPEFDVNKIILSATHTHTSPVLVNDFYKIPETGVTQVSDYQQFFAARVTDAIIKAWKERKGGASVTWGLGTAVVGYNRRAVYTAGTDTRMYGKTNLPEFRHLEGYEDHDVNSLFFWDKNKQLVAMSIEVPCPAQEVESRQAVNADYWYPVREKLKKTFGENLCVLGWIGAAGDQSPHLMYREKADERMIKLNNSTRVDQIANRIIRAVTETYEIVKNDHHRGAAFAHQAEILTLPMRKITDAEYKESKELIEKYTAAIAADTKATDDAYGRISWNSTVVKRYEGQQTNPNPQYDTEIHVVRIGDAVICTNQFELFTDYGIRIEARSKALQTFIIQLAGPGTYLPTERAVERRGYSAICQSNIVGPEGGQILVDRTVAIINELWNKN